MKRLAPAAALAASAAVFLLALWRYVTTLAPGVLTGDSAELQTIVHTGGFAHAGYPLYLLLGKAVERLVPFGSVAWRVNLLSALSAAAACAAIAAGLAALTGRLLPGIAAALLLAFSRTFWSQAVIAEVYALHALLVAGTLALLLAWYATARDRWLWSAAFLSGLALGHHPSMVLLGPPYLLFVLLVHRRPGKLVARTARAAGFVLLGLFPNAIYLLLAHRREVPTDFLHAVVLAAPDVWNRAPEDLSGIAGRIAFLYGGVAFREVMFAGDTARLAGQVAALPLRLVAQLGSIGLAAAMAGAVWAWRSRRGVFWLLAGVAMCQTFYNLNYGIEDIEVYYLPVYVAAAFLVGLGIDWLQRVCEEPPTRARLALVLVLVAAAVHLALAGPTAAWLRGQATRWPPSVSMALENAGEPPDMRWTESIGRRGEAIVDALPPNSLVLAHWETMYLVLYTALVEKGRRDLEVHEAYPTGPRRALSNHLRNLIARSLGERPVYFTFYPEELARQYRLEPVGGGILFRVAGSRFPE